MAELRLAGLDHWQKADAEDRRPIWQRTPCWLFAVAAHLAVAAAFLVTLSAPEETPADTIQIEMVAPPAPPAPPSPPEPIRIQERLKPQPIRQLALPRPMPKLAESPPVPASVPEMVLPHQETQPPPPAATAGPPPTYLSALYAHLAANKHYPRSALQAHVEGTALLRFTMNRQGRVLKFSLERSSGHEVLDAEVLQMIQRAQPLPIPPADMPDPQELVIPVEFKVH